MSRSLLIMLLVLTCSACSWVGMKKLPKNWRAESPPRCTQGNTPPALDVASGAAVAAIAGVYGHRVAGACESNCELEYLTTGVIAIAALVQWFAATDGFQYAARCREAHRERRTYKRGY